MFSEVRTSALHFHASCVDGVTAANIILQKSKPFNHVVPTRYDTLELLDYENTDIIVVDLSLPINVVIDLLAKGNRITILDHHITSENLLKDESIINHPNFAIIYTSLVSGAGVAWVYNQLLNINPSNGLTTRNDVSCVGFDIDEVVQVITEFINSHEHERIAAYRQISAYDSGRNMVGESQYITAGLKTHPAVIENKPINLPNLELTEEYQRFHDVGKTLIDYQCGLVERQRQHMVIETTESGIRFGVINLLVDLADIACQTFCRPHNLSFIVVHQQQEHGLKISMRGDNDVNKVNLSSIAELFDGGGHFHAAGFMLEKIHSPFELVNLIRSTVLLKTK